ncbi:MAG: DivIVA domain-containing protein [Brachybacterium sp.]|nr:DivIVA domain-containing protein [Brachybacterium sp.]
MDVRFTASRFDPGYDMAEVDDFLDRCDRALATGDASVTAETVLGAAFTVTRFRKGYDKAEVDRFLDDVLAPRFGDATGGSTSHDAPHEPATGHPATGRTSPVLHPAEQRSGFFSRLLRGR